MVILDWIKGVSIFCIIINHTDLLGRGIPVSHILNCLIVAMAVPMFMMVSGYDMMNAQINNGENAGGGYCIGVLKHQILKIIPSYTLIFLMEMICLFESGQFKNLDWKYFVFSYVIGGGGPGGYYVPIMIQLFLVMPIMISVIRKRPVWGVLSIFIINALFEFIINIVPFRAGIYRLIIVRYLFLLAMGAFLRVMKGKKLQARYLFLSLVIGLTYICVTNYFRLSDGTYTWSLFKYWQSTAFPVAFYIFPIFYLLLQKFSDVQIKTCFGTFMQKIGSMTWYIYCVQMLYFLIFYEICGLKYLLFEIPLICEFAVSFLLCIVGGWGLYSLEKLVRNVSLFFVNQLHSKL